MGMPDEDQIDLADRRIKENLRGVREQNAQRNLSRDPVQCEAQIWLALMRIFHTEQGESLIALTCLCDQVRRVPQHVYPDRPQTPSQRLLFVWSRVGVVIAKNAECRHSCGQFAEFLQPRVPTTAIHEVPGHHGNIRSRAYGRGDGPLEQRPRHPRHAHVEITQVGDGEPFEGSGKVRNAHLMPNHPQATRFDERRHPQCTCKNDRPADERFRLA